MEENKKTNKIAAFLKKNTVMVVALCAALITSCIVPVDAKYLGYFDFKTLMCLLCTLAVICGLRNVNFFYVLAKKVVEMCKNLRMSVIALVYITFIGSMLIANDMALLTFLPLGYFVLKTTKQEKWMAFTFIMQNIAANLGGMLTPFGNPQNLFLYSKFNIPNGEFFRIMFPPFLLSVILITVCCLFVKPVELKMENEKMDFGGWKTVCLLVLFTLSILIVFRVIPYLVGGIGILVCVFALDRKALRDVDYPLLLTFVFFFIFAGNMARMEPVKQFLSGLMEKNTLLFSTLSCQFISNVPSAILLSEFTADYPSLLVGVNIGGVGTLIASLASLITFREYTKHNPGKAGSYIGLFSLFNFSFLVILYLFCAIF